MTTSDDRVLVVGAAGPNAGLVVPELVRRGALVRGLVRHENQTEAVRSRGAHEVVVGDLTDRDSVREALDGVSRAFYIAPAFIPDEAEIGRAFVTDAVESGVRRIVFSSVIHPVLADLVNHAAKAPVEEAILNTGIEFTFLHPVLFFQMLEGSIPAAAESGTLAEPWSAETRFSRVDYRDVAEVAAHALLEDDLLWGTLDLAAPGQLNRHEVASLIADASGRDVKATRIDPDRLDVPAPMRAMFDHYDHTGLVASPLTLRAALGREPRSLLDYIDETLDQH
ncbi:epimerase [Kribbella sp. ALI-6-A]|uniref:NmrA family NAD(P)-binding protein n=1 Tax=Kribbella sp. ALI-6-A TaxID=1933817 RepID=UPI00097BEEED|nr:NmrA family NAD(P)-binding protein [Kribbella sp. ALI-6-A]ONI74366.1 epimerase [Kribbella sp. ALI-6-A]